MATQFDEVYANLERLQESVSRLFAGLDIGGGGPVVNLETMNTVHKNMSKVCELYEHLHAQSSDLYARIQSLHSVYTGNVERMRALVCSRRSEDSPDNAWSVKTRRGVRTIEPPPGFAITVSLPSRPGPSEPLPTGYPQDSVKQRPRELSTNQLSPSLVPITESVGILATRVHSFESVNVDGTLYYVVQCGHFAVKISGVLFHAGIGEIYTVDMEPVKIKECKYGEKCNRVDCTYYHDPLRCPQSRDIRNYVANSWLYAGPGSLMRARRTARNFGSISNLDADLALMEPEDVRRWMDQIAHDIVCGLVLSRFVRGV